MRDFGRERAAGVVAANLCLAVANLDDASLEGVREGQHRELDDRVVRGAEPRGLAVDANASAKLHIPRIRDPGGKEKRMQGAGLARVTAMHNGGIP